MPGLPHTGVLGGALGLSTDGLLAPASASSGELTITGLLVETLIGRLRDPEDVAVSSYRDIAERRFGRDLLLPGPGREVTPTISGDWPTLAGRPNLHAAVLRRQLTTPTQLVHRPEYGAGLELFVGELASLPERSRLAAASRQNTLRDPRIEAADVAVGEAEEGRVVLQLAIRPSGEIEAESVSIVTGV